MATSKIPVKDAMVTRVITITPEKTVAEAAKIMITQNIGGLVVVENKEPVGIITEKDFTKLIASKKDPYQLKIREAMSSPLITVSPETSIMDAAKLMTKSNIRKLPVKQDGKLVGIITAEDIVRVAPKELELLLELASIKAQENEEFSAGRKGTTSGVCEMCGNYSDYLYNVNGAWICGECKASLEEES